jgi:glyoxylase-like metal-dependent hydrolase (beta-lactamase superfamily II)
MRRLPAAVVAVLALSVGASAQRQAPAGLRLYVFDGGTLANADISRYRLRENEVATTRMSIACYAVVHPRGVLMWDACAVPDASWTPTGKPEVQHVTLPDGQPREVTLTQALLPQLAAAGIRPGAVSYLGLSHSHWDHTGNANALAGAVWITRGAEREAMFATPPPPLSQPRTYERLRTSKRLLVTGDEHDVFGDGSVVIEFAPGHTAAHQVLIVKLPRTGTVVLSGDLYHYPEERTLKRIPTFEADPAQTAASRARIETLLRRSGAQLWIQHDLTAHAKRRKPPEYYD